MSYLHNHAGQPPGPPDVTVATFPAWTVTPSAGSTPVVSVSTHIFMNRARRCRADPDSRHDVVVPNPFGAAAGICPQANRSRLAGMTRTSQPRILPGPGDVVLLLEQLGVSPAKSIVSLRDGALPPLQAVQVAR